MTAHRQNCRCLKGNSMIARPNFATVELFMLWLVTCVSLHAETGQPRTLAGHGGSVMAVAFSPSSETLASCSRDGTIKLWEVSTGKLAQTLSKHADDVY